MKKETYCRMMEAVGASASLRNCIIWYNRVVTWVVYLSYPLLLATLAVRTDPAFFPALLVPGISFVLLSLCRDRINAPRPYEKFGVPSVISKGTKGHSFPSRHVFSIFIIAVTMFRFAPVIGVVVGIAGALLAVSRVFGGVHFPRDVTAGAVIGLGCGILGFWVIVPFLQNLL